MNLKEEFDRQVHNLLQKGYPKLAGTREKDFLQLLEPLKEKIKDLDLKAQIPFVIVVKSELVKPEEAMQLIIIKGQEGLVNMDPLMPEDFQAIDNLEIPKSQAYLLLDIDTGKKTLNVTPTDAMEKIKKENRTPLTISEGVAVLTHFPEVLEDKEKYNAFSMLGSRRSDQRIPALWISYKKPRLGWCWANNPHTWLGSASAQKRLS